MKNDLAQAHRVFEATGQIPQTKHPFAWIEIQTGKMMTQAERYDAFMTKIGKNPRDVAFYENNINIDPVYITPEEFHAQHKARIADVQRELHDECHTGAMRFQPLARPDCERKILERNTNPQYIAERDEVHRKDREFYQKSNEHTEAVVNSEPLALVLARWKNGGWQLASLPAAQNAPRSGQTKVKNGER